MTLNLRLRQLVTAYGVWAVEYISRRPGGDVDVIVSQTLKPGGRVRYVAFRHDGVWKRLFGCWPDLERAVAGAEHTYSYAVLPSGDLRDLLQSCLPSERRVEAR